PSIRRNSAGTTTRPSWSMRRAVPIVLTSLTPHTHIPPPPLVAEPPRSNRLGPKDHIPRNSRFAYPGPNGTARADSAPRAPEPTGWEAKAEAPMKVATRLSRRAESGARAARRVSARSGSNERAPAAVLRDHADLLRERRAPHRARLHHARGRRADPVAAA